MHILPGYSAEDAAISDSVDQNERPRILLGRSSNEEDVAADILHQRKIDRETGNERYAATNQQYIAFNAKLRTATKARLEKLVSESEKELRAIGSAWADRETYREFVIKQNADLKALLQRAQDAIKRAKEMEANGGEEDAKGKGKPGQKKK